jgi:hypothetical protein
MFVPENANPFVSQFFDDGHGIVIGSVIYKNDLIVVAQLA